METELRGLFTSSSAALPCSLCKPQWSTHPVLGPSKSLVFFSISYCAVRTRAENIPCESQAVQVPEQYLQSIHAGIANCAFLLRGCFNVQSVFKANWDQGNIKSPHVLVGWTTSRHVSFLRSFQKSDYWQTKTKLKVPGELTTPKQISQDSFYKCNYLLFQVKHSYLNTTNLGTWYR